METETLKRYDLVYRRREAGIVSYVLGGGVWVRVVFLNGVDQWIESNKLVKGEY